MPKAGSFEYPSNDLETCIEKLKIARNNFGTDEMQREFIAESIGMTPKGGAFSNLISSCEKYGLVETVWGGKINLTNLGKLALYGMSDEQEKARNDAVYNVKLFQELYQKYGKVATEDQIRAFLRQQANIDIIKVQKIASEVAKIYNNVARYLTFVEQPAQVHETELEGIDRSDIVGPVITDDKTQPLKIQFRGVYIQLPPNDLDALEWAEKTIQFMKKEVEAKQEQKKNQ